MHWRHRGRDRFSCLLGEKETNGNSRHRQHNGVSCEVVDRLDVVVE